MDPDFQLVEQLQEPLLSKRKSISRFERDRLKIMSKRNVKKQRFRRFLSDENLDKLDTKGIVGEKDKKENQNNLHPNEYEPFSFLSSPHSPLYKAYRVLTSPARYIDK